MKTKVKKIYIILTYTGTMLSKIIKCYTKDEFSHVSISLDGELKQMYSFGRLKPYNPFIGGFVHEYIDKGTFKRFKKTTTRIVELSIDENKYNKLKEIIIKMEKKKDEYRFNIIGLLAVAFNLKIRFNKSFYCAEFVKYVIDESNIDIKLPELVKPEDFNELTQGKEVYRGLLQNYNYIQNKNIEKYNKECSSIITICSQNDN